MLGGDTKRQHFWAGFNQIDFDSYPNVIIAVSGGGDSMALLALAHDYFRSHYPRCRLVAVTVDHGLRAAAAREAQGVADYCAKLGIWHVTKKWNADRPPTGVQAAAREARYHLLAEAARESDAALVLTGHNLDDQLETIAMRAARAEGRGLAGICRATLYDRAVWFARPLLGIKRQELRDYLTGKKVGWIDDPSNEDEAFERVRMRNRKFNASERYQLLGVQKAAQAERRVHAAHGALLLSDKTQVDVNFEQHSAALGLMARSEAGFEPALQTLLCWVGQKQHFAPRDLIDPIIDLCNRGRNGSQFTVHGCLLSVKNGRLLMAKESRSSGVVRFCFDYLVPETEYALAKTFFERLNGLVFPAIPFIGAAR